MAMALGSDFREKLSDVTDCSICAEIFTNPKILPCVHTFCLHCLEKYGKDKKLGEMMACPLCRNKFVIPHGGLSKLPNNFFISKIVEIRKLATAPAKEAVCDLCCEETAVAKKFCIDCEQKLCDRCSRSHTRIKHCQNHQVVELGSQINVQELNLRNSYCEHHPKELIKMFCHEDNVAICLICCAESHQSHKCSNVDKAAGQFTEQLKDDLRKVANRRPECDEAFQKLKRFKIEFTEEIWKTEECIRHSGIKLKELIDQHIEELVQNLRIVRVRNLKFFETTKQGVDRFKVLIDSYQRYCDELLAIGSPVDICGAANQMHTRAIELDQLPVNCSEKEFYFDKIAFNSTNIEFLLTQQRTNNFVGELKVTKSSDRIGKFLRRLSSEVQLPEPGQSSCRSQFTHDIDVPACWKTMKSNEDFKRIKLNTSDQEYKDVEKAVLLTAETTVNQIVKIERIQNKRLYKQYAVRKAAMDAANPGVQNEMTLWHGTSADTLKSINGSGLNRSYCGKKATVCGRGVYFSKNFSYSAQNTYSPSGRNGHKYIYQCKVLTGEYAVGNENTIVSPFKPGSTTTRYDSTVDNVTYPTIFVIYYATQAYPKYLICFE